MKKSIATLGLFALLMVLTSVQSNAHITPLSNNNGQIEILNLNTMKLELGGEGMVGGNKKEDTPPKSEPTLLDKISDWWNRL
ncbi:hypothetical protein [Flavobacterium sp. FPG59]|jgi:hypothetical protein|uniref:hypothetical protein n=1 Tax=Flavobacterium sp. FPG59 TaxID=1929267 RepID=UPI000A39438A|nr:hypothetical protein [Flavobacterium sp. FPG59]OUD33927.1 hypothetical protein FPG59_13825 [Flavobacterium sp. FPG59]